MKDSWKKAAAVGVGIVGLYASLRAVAKLGSEKKDINQDNPYLGGDWGYSEAVGHGHAGAYERRVKPMLDGVLSFGGLVILSPLFLVISLAILVDDPGPVLFAQKRVGKDRRLFMLHKFRTMKMSTPHDVPTHQLEHPEQYITRVGAFLRKTSLDELPQVWDIFRGKMSIIGPRPALWNQEDLVAEREKYGANGVLPGLTGWAQINGRDELEIPDKARLDGEYVRHLRQGSVRALFFDCRCFLGTILSVLGSDGVVEGGTGEIHHKKKTIIVLSSHTPSLFWFRIEMMQEFQKRGCTVYAVGNEDEAGWKERFDSVGIPYKQISVCRNGTNPIRDLQTLWSLISLFQELKPDKIFTFQAKTVIYGGIAAKIAGVREVYPLLAGIGSVFLSDDMKSRVVRRVLVKEYKLAMKNVQWVFLQNKDDVTTFRKYGIVNERHKVIMLPGSGVNTEHFAVMPLPEKTVFLCISRLIRDKGVFEYLEACREIRRRHPGVRCLLVGPYDSNPTALTSEQMKEYIDDGSIEYFGEQKDVRPYIGQCSVFVLPSYREGTPKTNLEAMSCGRAVITTDVPGCRETVVDGENGLLVPPKDIRSLIEAMERLTESPEIVVAMGRNGREKAISKFDVKIVNRKICEIMRL